MAIYNFIFIYVLITVTSVSTISAAPNGLTKNHNITSISEDYKALRNDAQWLLQHIEVIADSLVQFLPSVTKEGSRSLSASSNNSTFIENTQLTLLLGLRHVLVGIKEISVSFQRRLSGDHEHQLYQLKAVGQLLQDIIRLAKNWFSLLRNSLAELFRIYNHYIPEVLLGKCFGKYITTTYPNRSFYEYPFILLGEVIEFGLSYLQSTQIYDEEEHKKIATTLEDDEISYEQNEIWPYGMGKYSRSLDAASDEGQTDTNVLNIQHPWQKCLKMYAADSISRQLKLYFIGE
ncbi:uncharacterized protein LOC101459023 [Ceratitis capitata]|uniref:uncharacterized protein LOC101459023 n=1 Tax=Ceratitis capitata TaxID=7213 RepID=UPI00032A0D16|nr:uncharacterized protein LOC101459023 [Ceratitis capitata]